MFSKKDLNRKNTEVDKKLGRVLEVYKVCSEKTLRVLNCSFERLKNECENIVGFLYNKLLTIVRDMGKVWKRVMDKIINISQKLFRHMIPIVNRYRKNLSLRLSYVKKAYEKGFVNAVAEVLSISRNRLMENKNLLSKSAYIAAPVATITIMLCTISYWNNLDYGLALAYDGEEIATIQDERTFEEANQMVNQKLIYNGEEDSGFGSIPTYKLVVSSSRYDSSVDVRDKIIEQSKDTIEEGTGLYIDDTLIGVVKDGSEVDEILKGILDSNITGENQEASFVQNVEGIDGLYPKESIITLDDLLRIVNTPVVNEEFYEVKPGDTPITIAESFGMSVEELEALNPGDIFDLMFEGMKVKVRSAKSMLSVIVTVTESYEKEIDFQTVETKDDTEYTDYLVVTQDGEKGKEFCVDKVSYIDGKEVHRESVSKTVIKEAVDKVVIVGTKERTASSVYTQGTGKSTGSLIWPVPYTHNITSYFGPRWGRMHTGIDISASGIYGKDIVAADGGIVVSSGYSSGYGNYVEIDHGNGVRTLYGHASELYVCTGTRVSKGMPIAAVGSTGFSTGPHCHFEVIVGGSQIDPLNYV